MTTTSEIETAILDEIDAIAPGCIPDGLDRSADMRDEMDLDSMDILNLVAALHERLGVDIPEADLDQVVTLAGAVAYIDARMSG